MARSELPALVPVLGDLSYGNPNGQAAVDQHSNDVMAWSQDTAWSNHEWDKPGFDDLEITRGASCCPISSWQLRLYLRCLRDTFQQGRECRG